MKNLLFILLAAAVLFLTFSIRQSRRPTPAVMTASAILSGNVSVSDARKPVVIELFTSEGCSSCPPADALLTQLVQIPPVPGAEIIALSEHVDYWNYIGWADPFASSVFSTRQQAYAQVFSANGGRGDVYTPQMVVDGQFEFVGSEANQARQAIFAALNLPKAKVTIVPVEPDDGTVSKLRIQVSELPRLSANEQAEVLLALTENNLVSSVLRGENSGRKLPHSAVTRELRLLGQLAPMQKTFEIATTVKLAENWNHSALRAVAFVQERMQRRILGAASTKLD